MLTTHEKKDIIEMLTEEGLDLAYHHAERPYYSCLCPFHQERNPSFTVYPDMQRWTCFSCDPGYHDVIDFFQKLNDWDFPTARDFCCTPLSDEEVAARTIAHVKEGTVDMLHLTVRMAELVDLLGVRHAQAVFGRIDKLLAASQWVEAERLLRWYGA